MARPFGGVSTDRIVSPQYAAINNLVTQTWAIWAYRTGAGGNEQGVMIDNSNSAVSGGDTGIDYAPRIEQAPDGAAVGVRWDLFAAGEPTPLTVIFVML